MRLAKFIALCGHCSRRRAEELIRREAVCVNGETADITTPVEPGRDTVTVNGEPLRFEEKVYILLNKPPGVLSTCKPGREKGRSLLELVKVPQRVFPVGRLDRDSAGLLILTNDGELAQKLTHPFHQVEKEYLVETDKPLSPAELDRMRSGVELEGTLCRFHHAETLGGAKYSIVLKQGVKRQIRRMVKAIGKKVIDLQRVREGSLKLGDLPEGKWRHLTPGEVEGLMGE